MDKPKEEGEEGRIAGGWLGRYDSRILGSCLHVSRIVNQNQSHHTRPPLSKEKTKEWENKLIHEKEKEKKEGEKRKTPGIPQAREGRKERTRVPPRDTCGGRQPRITNGRLSSARAPDLGPAKPFRELAGEAGISQMYFNYTLTHLWWRCRCRSKCDYFESGIAGLSNAVGDRPDTRVLPSPPTNQEKPDAV